MANKDKKYRFRSTNIEDLEEYDSFSEYNTEDIDNVDSDDVDGLDDYEPGDLDEEAGYKSYNNQFIPTKILVVIASAFIAVSAIVLICVATFTKGDVSKKLEQSTTNHIVNNENVPNIGGGTTTKPGKVDKYVDYDKSTASLNVTIVPGYYLPGNSGGGGDDVDPRPTKRPDGDDPEVTVKPTEEADPEPTVKPDPDNKPSVTIVPTDVPAPDPEDPIDPGHEGDDPNADPTPEITAAPTKNPEVTAEPTKEPEVTAEPTAEPTKEPEATAEPTSAPEPNPEAGE